MPKERYWNPALKRAEEREVSKEQPRAEEAERAEGEQEKLAAKIEKKEKPKPKKGPRPVRSDFPEGLPGESAYQSAVRKWQKSEEDEDEAVPMLTPKK